jgi:hypothetical protein
VPGRDAEWKDDKSAIQTTHRPFKVWQGSRQDFWDNLIASRVRERIARHLQKASE